MLVLHYSWETALSCWWALQKEISCISSMRTHVLYTQTNVQPFSKSCVAFLPNRRFKLSAKLLGRKQWEEPHLVYQASLFLHTHWDSILHNAQVWSVHNVLSVLMRTLDSHTEVSHSLWSITEILLKANKHLLGNGQNRVEGF